jgi:CubicO group peptidase (beta-lactamase class C family)/peptidoglycan/LPS O-acetylase OafA/YrhL
VPAAPPAGSAGRDRGLDLVRALALGRVVVWHATGAPVVTVLAALPLMFFVSGGLFAASAGRRGAWRTVADRLRRLGPPLWLFAAVAWAAMAVGALATGTSLEPGRVVWWVLPLTDPTGTDWEGGWLSSPLWYLRTLLWILLLAPLLVRAVRRAPALLLGAAAAIVVALEWLERGVGWAPSVAPRLPWMVGDVVLYGAFFALGAWWRTGGRQVSTRTWAAVAAAAAVLATVVWIALPPPGGVVNDSHLVHLVVGAATVAAVMSVAPRLSRLAEHRAVRPAVDLLGRRSLTIYLWHTTAIVGALWVLGRLGVAADGLGAPSYVVLVVAGTAVLVAATGWLEDLAARRPRRQRRARPTAPARLDPTSWRGPALVGLAAAVLVLAVAVPVLTRRGDDVEAAFRPRVPSQAPPPPSFAVRAEPETDFWARPAVIDNDALDEALAHWAEEHGVPGASAAIAVPGGGGWVGATGVGDDDALRTGATPVQAMSITKLFTANLVYRAVDSGLVGLDDPLPPLEQLPDSPLTGQVTVRQLLAHRTGLVNYRDTAPYHVDPSVVQSPADAVALSLDASEVAPGVPLYSSTNYLVLGYLLEQVTGTSYDQLLADALLGPLELHDTVHLGPQPGEPHFATAGIVADIDDLARAGVDLLVDHAGISEQAWLDMTAIDPDAGLGAGTMQFCPCADVDGVPQAFALGYAGGHTIVVHIPAYDVVVALDVTGDFYGDDGHFESVEPLLRTLVEMVRPAPDPSALAPA